MCYSIYSTNSHRQTPTHTQTEVIAEEKAIRQKANEVRAKKEEIEMARGITMEDLTKGLLNYKYTGLTFEKGAKAGDLRYVYFFFNLLHIHMDHLCFSAKYTHLSTLSIFDYIIKSTASNLQNLIKMIPHDRLHLH